MKSILMITFLFSITSCATMSETIPGYTAAEIRSKTDIEGLNRASLVKKLGKPIAEGECYSGGKIGVGRASYTMVYLKKDTPRYIWALDAGNKKTSVKCTYISLSKNKSGEYILSSKHFSGDQTSCTQSYGIITNTRDRNKCRQIYK